MRMLSARATLGAALLLASVSARATPPETAKRYVDAANQAYQAGQYELAVRAYEEAFRLLPVPAITFSIAQANRLRYYQDHELDHLRRALELYRRYLDEAPRGNRRSHATLHIEAIESILRAAPPAPPLTAETPPAAPAPAPTELMVVSRTPHARARIDSSDYLEVPFARGVTPGKRTVEMRAPGFASARSEWLALSGRLVVAGVELTALPAIIHVTAPAGTAVRVDGGPIEGTEASVRAGVHVVSVTSRGRRPAVQRVSVGRGERADVEVSRLELTDRRVAAIWTLSGAGALAVAGGVTTALALSAEQRVRDYDEGIGRRTYTDAERAERNSALDRRDRFRTASWALFGGAAALGVTGAVLWWFDQPDGESATKGVTPVIAPETAGVAWRAAF